METFFTEIPCCTLQILARNRSEFGKRRNRLHYRCLERPFDAVEFRIVPTIRYEINEPGQNLSLFEDRDSLQSVLP